MDALSPSTNRVRPDPIVCSFCLSACLRGMTPRAAFVSACSFTEDDEGIANKRGPTLRYKENDVFECENPRDSSVKVKINGVFLCFRG